MQSILCQWKRQNTLGLSIVRLVQLKFDWQIRIYLCENGSILCLHCDSGIFLYIYREKKTANHNITIMLFNCHDQVHIYYECKYHYHFGLIVCTFWFVRYFFSTSPSPSPFSFTYVVFHIHQSKFSERSTKNCFMYWKWTIVKLECFFSVHLFKNHQYIDCCESPNMTE